MDLQNDCYQVEDFRTVFDGVSEHIFYDEVHLSDRGNEIVSKKILEVIESTLLASALSN